ncbi:hypothetical protein H0H93_005481 [Arthromyces matolae]|nr:hypothetical protein H0H93_005481 [Arthromyces matolae]
MVRVAQHVRAQHPMPKTDHKRLNHGNKPSQGNNEGNEPHGPEEAKPSTTVLNFATPIPPILSSIPVTHQSTSSSATSDSIAFPTQSSSNTLPPSISSTPAAATGAAGSDSDSSASLTQVTQPGTPTIVIPGGGQASDPQKSGSSIIGFTFPNSGPSSTISISTARVSSSSSHDVLNAGGIAGAVLGALVFLVIVFFAIVWFKRRRKRIMAPSAEFLNWSFQTTPHRVQTSPAYPFGSAYATSSHDISVISHTPTVGHDFKFPRRAPRDT